MMFWKEKEWQLATLVMVIFVIVAAYSIRVAYVQDAQRRRGTSDCYETPSAVDVSRTLTPAIHAYGGLYTCGLYSRTALPDVIRCYELKEGCSE
jgi:hypothetical protein